MLAVTGAGGFVGRHLLACGSLGATPIRAFLGPGDSPLEGGGRAIELHDLDLRAPRGLEERLAGADTVVHLAGPACVASSFEDPDRYLDVHVLGTQRVIEGSVRAGVKRIVHVSSAEVYGQPNRNPVPETAALAPRSPYAAAKAGGEMVVRAASAKRPDATFVILRPFLVYGPGMRTGGVVHRVLAQAVGSDRIRVADPAPVRDFCFVEDVVEAILVACRAPLDEPLTVLNVGTGRGASIANLAAAAAAAAGRDLPAEASAERDRPGAADIAHLVADTTRAEAALGWRARVPLEDGLRAVLRRDLSFQGAVHV